jgi:hypothetical protein
MGIDLGPFPVTDPTALAIDSIIAIYAIHLVPLPGKIGSDTPLLHATLVESVISFRHSYPSDRGGKTRSSILP